ncbi:hypothetical protein IAE22_32275, partial [Bacillus sp. S34]|nr:hypothetical protein [Bacillus sp. S34]
PERRRVQDRLGVGDPEDGAARAEGHRDVTRAESEAERCPGVVAEPGADEPAGDEPGELDDDNPTDVDGSAAD